MMMIRRTTDVLRLHVSYMIALYSTGVDCIVVSSRPYIDSCQHGWVWDKCCMYWLKQLTRIESVDIDDDDDDGVCLSLEIPACSKYQDCFNTPTNDMNQLC